MTTDQSSLQRRPSVTAVRLGLGCCISILGERLAESFFSRLRDKLLNMEEFINLAEMLWFAKRRLHEHNEERPYSSLSYKNPAEFASQCPPGVRT